MFKVKECHNILLKCKDARPGEAEYIIAQKSEVATMFKHCDPEVRNSPGQVRARAVIRDETRKKRSANSEEEQKNDGRD